MAKPLFVAVSPRTGKEIKRPRKGQEVTYAVRTARGTLKKFPDMQPQSFLKSDLAGFNKILAKSDGKNFVLYEQLSRVSVKVQGKVQYRERDGKPLLDKAGRRIPLKQVKVTFKQGGGKQRPVIVELGRALKKHVQDYAFRKQTKREAVDLKLASILPLRAASEKAVYSEEIHIQGPTIFSTLKNIKPAANSKAMRQKGFAALWVEGVVRVRSPEGDLVSALRFSTAVKQLRNFSQQIAKEVRYKLADVGYRFTALTDLKRFQADLDRRGVKADVMRIGVLRKRVETLRPLQPETAKGARGKGRGFTVSVSLKLTGFRDKKSSGRKKKK